MNYDDKGNGNEGLEVIITRDGGRMSRVHIATKGPLTVFLVFLSLFMITGYLWVNGNEQPESMRSPEERSFPGLNYRICDIITKQQFNRSV